LPNKVERPAEGRPPRAPAAAAPLADWLRWQEALHPQAIALGLERVAAVAARLGLPAAGPVTFTVAGTNGKGSTCALLSGICRAAGYPVGTYTSPHLLRYNERVAIDGEPVADAALTRAFAAIEDARRDTPLTYFEFGTLAALWLFREAGVAVQVLEVGLGGRLDAVNLVDADCAVITSIGLDHVEYLGNDREQIGGEKAGILRAGRPAVCSDPDPPASIGRRAAELGASLWQLGREFRVQAAADAWNWHGPTGAGSSAINYKKLPPPALPGAAQIHNAAGVVAAIERLRPRLPIPEAALRTGLAQLRLPGRFERRAGIVMDVAHNVEAARVLADNLRSLAPAPGPKSFRFVMGMLSDKPVEGFAQALAPLAAKFHAGGLPPPRGLDGAQLARRMAGCGVPTQAHPSVAAAFAAAREEVRAGETIVACGSFLTVAAVAERLDG
jgi:dihydrofolate synthase / folylpolyglutamate synthase